MVGVLFIRHQIKVCMYVCKELPCFVSDVRHAFSLFQTSKPYICFLYSRICHFLFKQPAKTCLKSYVNRCHISAGTHKFKSAVLVLGVPFRNQHRKNLNMFCRVNQAGRAQNYWPACQNFRVPCPK